MQVIQMGLKPMDTFCYILGDEATKSCALIDPAFETEKILDIARKAGYRVTHLINTHCHSDHTAGNAEIIAATGARLLIHSLDAKALGRMLGGKGSPEPDVLLEDGDIITIGDSELKVIHTPGHTPGSICIYFDGNIFTGDTLFVEAVGRTDLPGGSIKTLMESIHKKIYTLPDETIVWPGHDYGPRNHSTVGYEKANNLFT
jgi:glyoxylase-like metal-dependent hydrolase (beta-lactamase superfamily II)